MIEAYEAYFREVAEQHKQLAHVDAYGERCFEFMDIAEAFGSIRDGVRPQGFIFRLFRPYRRFVKREGGTFRVLEGGFLIAKFGDVRQQGDGIVTLAMDESLLIVDQVVARMVGDSRNGHPLFEYGADKADALGFQALPATNVGDGTYHGFSCTFELSAPFEATGDCEPDAWLDGGVTDY